MRMTVLWSPAAALGRALTAEEDFYVAVTGRRAMDDIARAVESAVAAERPALGVTVEVTVTARTPREPVVVVAYDWEAGDVAAFADARYPERAVEAVLEAAEAAARAAAGRVRVETLLAEAGSAVETAAHVDPDRLTGLPGRAELRDLQYALDDIGVRVELYEARPGQTYAVERVDQPGLRADDLEHLLIHAALRYRRR